MRNSLASSAGSACTTKPHCCAILDGLSACDLLPSSFTATPSSGWTSAIVMDRSRELPRCNTVTVVLVPGLVLPTRRGKSENFSTALPSYRVITSPASMPAFCAGEPISTPRTNAPSGLARPMESAMSLVTGSICTPIRPRLTRPEVRNWSLTRIASSTGIANEIPMKPPERE